MQLRPSQLMVLIASVAIVIAGFMHFIKIDNSGLSSFERATDCSTAGSDVLEAGCEAYKDGGITAWDTKLLFPLAAWPAILGLAVAIIAGLRTFADKRLPAILGFSPEQLDLALAIPAALISLAWLVQGTDEFDEWGMGFWLTLIGSIVLLVGAAMEAKHADGGSAPAAAGTPTAF